MTLVNGKDIPTKNAFSMYDELLAGALKTAHDENIDIIAISLGTTASVLAFDLYER